MVHLRSSSDLIEQPAGYSMHGMIARVFLPTADCDVDLERIDLNAIAEATDSLGRD